MRWSLIIRTLACCIVGSSAQADLCSDIRLLHEQGGEMTLALPGTDLTTVCTRSLMLSGGSQVHCGWAFPYRASAATGAFQQLLEKVKACADGAQATADPDVNHPDFYELRTYRLSDHDVGVSLKDKAALGETYVFLRVAPLD